MMQGDVLPAALPRPGPGEIPIADAAAELGITTEALRKRLQRSRTIKGRKRGQQWFVLTSSLPSGRGRPLNSHHPDERQDIRQDAAAGQQPGERQDTTSSELAVYRELVGTLRAEVDLLIRELEVRTEELRRKDHLLAAFAQRLPELAQAPSPSSTTPANPAASMAAPRHRRWWWPW
jgi:hypothetical protein